MKTISSGTCAEWCPCGRFFRDYNGRYAELFSDAELRCPYTVRDVFATAYETTKLYRLKPEDWLSYLEDELDEFFGIFIDEYGNETFPDIRATFGVSAAEMSGAKGNGNPRMLRVRTWFALRCCRLPAGSDPAPLPKSEREYFRLVASVLRIAWPQNAAFFGLRGDNDNNPASARFPPKK
jgi:hypothetical protein